MINLKRGIKAEFLWPAAFPLFAYVHRGSRLDRRVCLCVGVHIHGALALKRIGIAIILCVRICGPRTRVQSWPARSLDAQPGHYVTVRNTNPLLNKRTMIKWGFQGLMRCPDHKIRSPLHGRHDIELYRQANVLPRKRRVLGSGHSLSLLRMYLDSRS